MNALVRSVCWCLPVAAYLAVPLVQAAEFSSHGYILAGIGNADTKAHLTVDDTIDGDDTAFEIGAGYAFSRNLAVELSYQDFGKPSGFSGCPVTVFCVSLVPFSQENVEVEGWTIALRGVLPMTGKLSGFARGGLLAWDSSGRTPGMNDSGTDLLVGVGFSANLNDRVDLQLSYETANVDIDTLKLGALIRF